MKLLVYIKKYLVRFLNIIALALLLVGSSNAQNGIVKGRIYDIVSNEALPFVNVVIVGTTIGSVTDLDGNFLITGLQPGFVRVSVSFVGYKPKVSAEIEVTNAKSAYLELALEQSDLELGEVTIKVSPFQKTDESPVSLTAIGLSEIEYNPGSNRDISRVIQSFPGVGSGVSFRNDVIIRGGSPAESRFFLDGVEIPNLNHFGTQGASGGAVGIINADFISAVDFYSGAFPANRGNALSGVFEFTQKDGNKDKLRFRGSLGASEVSLTADGPVGEKTSFIFSARQSYLQFLFSAIGLPFLPTFTDYQFKSRTRFDEKNELTIVSIGALDQFSLNTDIENPDESQEYILSYLPVNEQWNYAIGGVYKHFRENSYTTLVLSRNMLNNNSFKYPDNNESLPKVLDYQSQEIENKFRLENNVRLAGYKLVYGINSEYVKYNNSTYQQIFANNELLEVDYNSDLDFVRYGAFSQISRSFVADKLTLSLGLRFDGNNYSNSMANPVEQISPRFSASYKFSELWSFSFNTGRYFQLPAYTTLGYRDNSGVLKNKDNNLKYITSNQIIAGVERLISSHSQVKVEGFYKSYSNYPYSLRDGLALANKGGDYGVVGDEEVVSKGEGRAYGLEVLTRSRFPNGLNIIFAYTFVRSEFKGRENEYLPSSWDSRHLMTFTLGKSFGRNWNVGMKWRFSGGLPYTPYDLTLSANKQAWDTQGKPFLDYTSLNSERLKVFHQLDVRLDRRFFFRKWSLMLYVDIQNFYNFKSQQQDYIVREKDAIGNIILLDNGTKYQLKSISNTSGTVLPTIGVMFEF